MLNPTNPNNSSTTTNELNIAPADFIMHTMQDDLASLKNNYNNPSISFKSTPLPKIQAPLNNAPAPFAKPPLSAMAPEQKQPFETKLNPAQTVAPIQAPTPIPIPTTLIQEKKAPDGKTLYKVIFLIIILVVIAIVGFGFYYVYTTTKNTNQPAVTTTTDPTTQQPSQQNLPTEEAVIIAPSSSKYATAKPNFLVIDLTLASLADLEAQFSSIAEEIKLLPVENNYEFLVVDKNNNPVEFKTFAQAAKLSLSPALLTNLTKEFSLFFYNDSGSVRLGIAIKTASKDKAKLIATMLGEEKTLVSELTFLFLKSPIDNSNKTFTVSAYSPNNEIVRYLNLNNEKTLSVDYVATADKLFIGTSRQALRAIYQKVATATPVGMQSETNPMSPTSLSPQVGN